MSDFPQKFSVRTTPRTTHYVLNDSYYAVWGAVEDRRPSDFELHSEDDRLTVRRKQPGETIHLPPSNRIGPVYRVGDRGPLAVPTGKVFVRFAETDSFGEHREQIEQAGFKVVQALAYAPQAGWVEPRSGAIADAINKLGALSRIKGVEVVEPQMLLQPQRRP